MNGIKNISVYPTVKLTVVPSEKFKTSYLSVTFSRPLCEKEAPMNALIPEVLTRSCKKYPTMLSLSRALQSLYGASIDPMNSVMGENHLFGLYATFTENRYAFDGTDIFSEVADLISEMLLNPLISDGAFDESVVESEKEKLCGRIKARINNPAAWAMRRCIEIMCASERYSISPSGTVESVSALDAKSLFEYYESLRGKTEISVFYAGSESFETVEKKIREIFRDFSGPAIPFFETEIIRSASGEVKTVIEEEKVAQGKLTMGLRSSLALSDENYHVLALTSALLGASPTSKLFMNVREKMSLCYYCSSRPNALKGLLTISSGIEVENFEKARDAILCQIDAIRSGDFTDAELESAKKSLINSYRELTDSPSGLVFWYLTRSFAKRDDSPLDAANAVLSVTRDEVIEAAKGLSLDTVYFLKGTLCGEDDGEECEE